MAVIKHVLADDLTIYQGHVTDGLRQIPDKSVQCIVTSDPYLGLRSYGTPPLDWPEVTYRPMAGVEPITVPAWRGEYGQEPDPLMYVGHSVLIRRELWRVLRDDGVMWVDLGDSFNGSGGAGGDYGEGGLKEGQPKYSGLKTKMLKPKDLAGIPERVALALQADGWYWRSKAPWLKANAMPSSVTDRPSVAHETWGMFTKSERYFYDEVAVQLPGTVQSSAALSWKRNGKHSELVLPGQSQPQHRSDREPPKQDALGKRQYTGFNERYKAQRRAQMYPEGVQDDPTKGMPSGSAKPDATTRNRRTTDWWNESLDLLVEGTQDYLRHLLHIKEHGGLMLDPEGEPLAFKINPQAFAEAHFAAFGPKLITPCILSSTSPQACPHCGAPWERVTEKERTFESGSGKSGNPITGKNGDKLQGGGATGDIRKGPTVHTATLGWQPTCSCDNNDGSGKCIVLDPFGGSMTTIAVAVEHGRAGIACELNPEYIQIGIRARLCKTQTSLLGRL